jgi:uroporphyrinogen-III synthase
LTEPAPAGFVVSLAAWIVAGERAQAAGAERVRVIVTRPRAQAGPLVERLEALGLDVVACPLIEIERTSDERIDASGYDWLVVTSPNGADELARRLVPPRPKVAAVGPGTAERLRAHGVEPALVPRVSTQAGLLDELPWPPGRVLLAAAEDARRLLVERLGADFLPLYRTRLLEPDAPPEGDLVVLASGSAARAFARLGLGVPAVSIGPQTTRAASEAGLRVVAEAETYDLDGLVAAVARVASART